MRNVGKSSSIIMQSSKLWATEKNSFLTRKNIVWFHIFEHTCVKVRYCNWTEEINFFKIAYLCVLTIGVGMNTF